MSWCQWSFWNSQPLPSKDQDLPWRLTSELPPPQLGDPAHPQLTASRSQHWPESSLQVEKPHPPPESRAYRFCFYFSLQRDFHLLDIKVDVNCVICMKLNMTYVNVEWPILSDLVFVTGCDVMCFPFPWKLKSNSFEEASAICKFCWYHSSGVSLILSLGQKLPIFMDTALGIKSCENSSHIQEGLRHYWDSLSCLVKCKSPSPRAVRSFVLQEQWTGMRANEQTAEMIRRPCRTRIEPVNRATLSCREMARLTDPHDQTAKGTHTHIYPKTSSQLAPPLVPVWEVAELHRGLHKADQGQHRAAEPSSHCLSFCRSWGCPRGWRGCETGASFIASICWRDASRTNGCSWYNQSYKDVILFPAW